MNKKLNETLNKEEITTHHNGKSNQFNGESETNQITTNFNARLTTQQGVSVSDDENSLHLGMRGPTLIEDHVFREKLFHFDHERIPERVVHVRGAGAHGYFETYESLSDITFAELFNKKGKKTPVFVRFSTVSGSKGSSDLARDVRGFAVKFYTQEGNWDLVGNNIPVFFIQDAIKFPDLIHAVKEEPDCGFPQAQTAHDNFWDFVSLMPESMNMLMWIMSDRTLPRSFRFMEGFGVHTFRLVSAEGKSTFVKFHWKPKLGLQSVLWDESIKINGADPDFHRRDLWDSIQSGHYPEWELGMQLFDEKFADNFSFDVLDATKLIPEEEVPVRIVGRLVLNRCVDNFFAETEQVAFCTQNIIPGIDFTNDPLLQGRNFSYLDTQLKRLGSPNFAQLPINAPKCPIHLFQQDGHMTMKNPVGRVNYSPNSWSEKSDQEERPIQSFTSYLETLSGYKQRSRSESFSDHYSQARQFYLSQTPIEQEHIKDAFVFELSKVKKEAIRRRMVAHLLNIDQNFAENIAIDLGFSSLPEPILPAKAVNTKLLPSQALSILKNTKESFVGRKVGIVVNDNINDFLLENFLQAAEKAGAKTEIIAQKIGGVVTDKGKIISAQRKIEGAPSVFYDAIALFIDEMTINKLSVNSQKSLHDFIHNAYFHFKFIAYTHPLQEPFNFIDLTKNNGCICINNIADINTFFNYCKRLRAWERLI